MALNCFTFILLVSAAPELLAEIKRAICSAFSLLILRFELSRHAIENKVYYDFGYHITGILFFK